MGRDFAPPFDSERRGYYSLKKSVSTSRFFFSFPIYRQCIRFYLLKRRNAPTQAHRETDRFFAASGIQLALKLQKSGQFPDEPEWVRCFSSKDKIGR
jgi:hypothetical protein